MAAFRQLHPQVETRFFALYSHVLVTRLRLPSRPFATSWWISRRVGQRGYRRSPGLKVVERRGATLTESSAGAQRLMTEALGNLDATCFRCYRLTAGPVGIEGS
jgi:hypothetical protein